ncbi:DUF3307 domain-containing protein [bacterium]|nr:DUF3307 domain-containing protein [bacterium]
MEINILLLSMLTGHLLGDFVFQTDQIANKKTKNAGWFLFHVMSVAIITWLLLGSLSAWRIAGFIFISHLLIDLIKIWISSREKRGEISKLQQLKFDDICLIFEQVLHVAMIIFIWLCTDKMHLLSSPSNHWVDLFGLRYTKGLVLMLGITACVWGVGIVLKFQMAKFADALSEKIRKGLPRGGRTIGMLERMLIFMFVLVGKPEGVGFLVAAKSVFRIGDLTNRDDKDHAEYIMIGTLRSFTYALVVSFITKWIIKHLY